MPAFLAAAAPYIATGLSGLFGMLNNRNKQTSARTASTTPTMDPAYGPLQAMLIQHATQRLANPTSLPANYESNGVNTINRSYDLATQGLNNNLTSRGLSTSPGAGSVLERLTASRAGAVGQFRAGVPLAARELEDRDMASVAQLLNFGRGTTATSTGTDATEGGGGLAGAGNNMLSMIGFLMGQGLLGGQGSPSLNNTVGRVAPTIPGWTIPRGLVGGANG